MEGVQVAQVEEKDGEKARQDEKEGRGGLQLQGLLQVEEEVELVPAIEEIGCDKEVVLAIGIIQATKY